MRSPLRALVFSALALTANSALLVSRPAWTQTAAPSSAPPRATPAQQAPKVPKVLAPAAPAAPPAAPGTPPRVALLGCKEGLHITSQGATLSQLLRRMAQTLHFEHEYWAPDDPVLNLDLRIQPVEAMKLLADRANLIVRYAPDRRCRDQLRITAVWVLPQGETSIARYRIDRPRIDVPAADAAVLPVNPDGGVNDYLRAHGLLPAPAAPASAPGGG
jgi:hypothetical protein